MDDQPSPSQIYCVPDADVQAVLDAVPPRMFRRPRRLRMSVRAALAAIRQEQPEGSAEWLVDRLKKWLKSGEFQGEHFREVCTWIEEEGYDEPDEAWATRASKAGTARNDTPPLRQKPDGSWTYKMTDPNAGLTPEERAAEARQAARDAGLA